MLLKKDVDMERRSCIIDEVLQLKDVGTNEPSMVQ